MDKYCKVGDILYLDSKPYAICCGEGLEFRDKIPRFILLNEQYYGLKWSMANKLIPNLTQFKDSDYIYDEQGYEHTQIIKENFDNAIFHDSAFDYCMNIPKNSELYDIETYLPAQNELYIMFKHSQELNKKINELNGKMILNDYLAYYISSTQVNKNQYSCVGIIPGLRPTDYYIDKTTSRLNYVTRPMIRPKIKNLFIENKLNDDKKYVGTLYNDKIQKTYKKKQKVKNKKYFIGNTYMLRYKSIEGSQEIIKKFILKKYIYDVNETDVNILILKQIDGLQNNIYTLTKSDCLKYHIKYEPGLQVFSMNLNFIKI